MSFEVEVIYAERDVQRVVRLKVTAGASVGEVVQRSGLPAGVATGSYGRVRAAEDILTEGERIEILRPLLDDPKNARRLKAAKARKSGAEKSVR